MSKLIAVILILVGGWLIYTGYSQADSPAGRTRTALANLKNDIDGKNRVPRQYWYYGAGVVFIVAGTGLVFRRPAT